MLGGTGARRLQRQDHRPARTRRRPTPSRRTRRCSSRDERADQHEAAARDLRRRCEVHARGDGGPARSRHAVLPAGPRARSRRTRGRSSSAASPATSSTASKFAPLRERLEDTLLALIPEGRGVRVRAAGVDSLARSLMTDGVHRHGRGSKTKRRHDTSTWTRPRRLPDPARSRCTATRSCIWTTPTRPRSRRQVLDALVRLLRCTTNANIHRATHLLSERATRAYERSARAAAAVHQRRRQPRGHPHARAAPKASTWWRSPGAARS